jgi:hypothetical protein
LDIPNHLDLDMHWLLLHTEESLGIGYVCSV